MIHMPILPFNTGPFFPTDLQMRSRPKHQLNRAKSKKSIEHRAKSSEISSGRSNGTEKKHAMLGLWSQCRGRWTPDLILKCNDIPNMIFIYFTMAFYGAVLERLFLCPHLQDWWVNHCERYIFPLPTVCQPWTNGFVYFSFLAFWFKPGFQKTIKCKILALTNLRQDECPRECEEWSDFSSC